MDNSKTITKIKKQTNMPIGPQKAKLIKDTSTHYRTKNKSRKLQKQIDFIQKKLDDQKNTEQ